MTRLADQCSVLHGSEVVFTGTRNECLQFRTDSEIGWAFSVTTPVEEAIRKFYEVKR